MTLHRPAPDPFLMRLKLFVARLVMGGFHPA